MVSQEQPEISNIGFIGRLIISAISFPLLLVLLITSLAPFLEDSLTDTEIRTTAALLSLLVVVTLYWIPYIRNAVARRTEEEKRIGEIAAQVIRHSLTWEEIKEINDSAGWSYNDIPNYRFAEDDLKLAFDLAKNQERKNEAFEKQRSFIFMILSFLMVPFGFAGLLYWGSDVEALLSGSFCLVAGVFFFTVISNSGGELQSGVRSSFLTD
jgi:hypothetical protein